MSDYWADSTDALPLFAPRKREIDLPIRSSVSHDLRIRAGSQRWELLRQYVIHGPLTNEQAGDLSGLSDKRSCCYWKRCSELLEHGYIEATGEHRASQAGETQRVCRATAKGRDAIQGGAVR